MQYALWEPLWGHRRIFPKSYAKRMMKAVQCVAQTNVCATVWDFTVFQGLAFCLILLPNTNVWQQEKATLMLLGYARVSKSDGQKTAPQIRALKEAGCKKIFEESASGGRWNRPELHRLLDPLRPGDTLIVWKLDRL